MLLFVVGLMHVTAVQRRQRDTKGAGVVAGGAAVAAKIVRHP